jgi:hypothetical protein
MSTSARDYSTPRLPDGTVDLIIDSTGKVTVVARVAGPVLGSYL